MKNISKTTQKNKWNGQILPSASIFNTLSLIGKKRITVTKRKTKKKRNRIKYKWLEKK
jgi:hypothetical protein